MTHCTVTIQSHFGLGCDGKQAYAINLWIRQLKIKQWQTISVSLPRKPYLFIGI